VTLWASLRIPGWFEEFLTVGFRAKPHHPLDTGAVVPASVEQRDFAGGWQMRHIPLEIPLGPFALTGAGRATTLQIRFGSRTANGERLNSPAMTAAHFRHWGSCLSQVDA
jgi:hypothetical protein